LFFGFSLPEVVEVSPCNNGLRADELFMRVLILFIEVFLGAFGVVLGEIP